MKPDGLSQTMAPATSSDVSGDFYVAKDECMGCGAPEAESDFGCAFVAFSAQVETRVQNSGRLLTRCTF